MKKTIIAMTFFFSLAASVSTLTPSAQRESHQNLTNKVESLESIVILPWPDPNSPETPKARVAVPTVTTA